MPMYRYKDENSEVQLDVLRPFAEFNVEPTEEEVQAEKRAAYVPPAEGGRKWVRVIASPLIIRGGNWQGKGNW